MATDQAQYKQAKERFLINALKSHMTFVALEYYRQTYHAPKEKHEPVYAGSFAPFRLRPVSQTEKG
jgi:hypothetical protein